MRCIRIVSRLGLAALFLVMETEGGLANVIVGIDATNGSYQSRRWGMRADTLTQILAGALLIWFIWQFLSLNAETDQPSIDMRDAVRILWVHFPNLRILEMELERKDGRLLYKAQVRTAAGEEKELYVNAQNGEVEDQGGLVSRSVA